MGILQEKFQVDNAPNANDDARGGWASSKSARTKKGLPGREGRSGGDPASRQMNNALELASLPPGADIEDQETTDQRRFKSTMGGESDVSKDWNAEAVKRGFKHLPMRATDDEYSNAHVDAFYDEMVVDGEVGFAERNNMLDRL